MSKPTTFMEIAEREEVITCFGFDCPVPKKAHDRGWANISSGILHWSPRRVTKAGLRRFLLLSAAIRHSHNRGQPKWLQIYEQNAYAARRALSEYHVRLPRHLSLTDRAKVRLLMTQDASWADSEWLHVVKWSQER